MVKGPFHHSRHVHEFREVDGTVMIDDFDYASPLGPLGWIADVLIVRRYLERSSGSAMRSSSRSPSSEVEFV